MYPLVLPCQGLFKSNHKFGAFHADQPCVARLNTEGGEKSETVEVFKRLRENFTPNADNESKSDYSIIPVSYTHLLLDCSSTLNYANICRHDAKRMENYSGTSARSRDAVSNNGRLSRLVTPGEIVGHGSSDCCVIILSLIHISF